MPLLLVAIGIPAAFRAALGRPRSLASAWLAGLAAVAIAQAAGELTGSRLGVLGDAQVLYAIVAGALTSALLALRERPRRGR